jgi:hypothetical protein
VIPDRGAPSRSTDKWKYVLSTRAIFRQIDGLHHAAQLVGHIYENWDGTGMPDHLGQGQIPLRCRIVRVLIDLIEELEAPGNPDADLVLKRMMKHGGTLYDPGVVVHLLSLVEEKPDAEEGGSRIVLGIDDLCVGMVLAEDLYTDSGIKLLARGTTLTTTSLETIRRRHRFDPIPCGAAVRRKVA